MTVSVGLYEDPDAEHPVENVVLGDVEMVDEFSVGEPRRIFMRNTGDSHLREISLSVVGEGDRHIQLARDENGSPGVWADTGQGIVVESGTLFSGGQVSFWARGIFALSDREDTFEAEFRVRAKSVGGASR